MLGQEPKVGDRVVVFGGSHSGRGILDIIEPASRSDGRDFGIKMVDKFNGAKVGQFVRREEFKVLLDGVTLTYEGGEVW